MDNTQQYWILCEVDNVPISTALIHGIFSSEDEANVQLKRIKEYTFKEYEIVNSII